MSTHNRRVNLIIIDTGSLREPLCHHPRFVSYHHTKFIPLSEEDPFASYMDDLWRCWTAGPKT